MLKTHRILTTLAIALTFMSMPLIAAHRAAAALPDADSALGQVPATSAMVIYLPKISDADAKIVKFLQASDMDKAMSIKQNTPIFPMLLDELGIPDGVDLDGSGAFVMPVLQVMGRPQLYFIVPIKDKDKFMGNFTSAQPVPPSPNGQTYEGVQMVKPKRGPTTYIKFSGNYAVFGTTASVVSKQAAEDPKTLIDTTGSLGRSVVTDADAVLYLNMAKISPMVQPMINMFLQNMQMQMTQNPDAAAAMGGPEMAVAAMQFYGFALNTMFSDTQALVVGANIHDKHVTARTAIQFKDDSTLAKSFTGKADTPPSMNNLPAEGAFLACGAINNAAMDFQPLLDAFNENVLKNMPADAPGHSMLELYVDGIGMLKKINALSLLWVAPTKGQPQSLMNMICVYDCDHPAEIRDQYRKQFKTFADAIGSKAGNQPPMMTASIEPDALTVAGHKTDRILFKITPPAQPQNGRIMMANPMMQMFNQPIQYLMTDLDKSMVFSAGEQAQFETALKAAASSNGDFLKKEKLAAIRKELPAGRFAEGYFDLGRYVDFVSSMMMAMFGNAPNVQTPDLPPVAFAASADSSGGVLITTIVAADMVKGIHDYTTAVQTAMRNGNHGPVRVADPNNNAGAPTEIFTVSDKEFNDKVVNAKYPVVVVFTANYSMDGKKQEKVFQDMMQQYMGDVGFARVDTGTDNRTAEQLKLGALPTTVVYANGKLVQKFSGLVSKEKLIEAVNPYLK